MANTRLMDGDSILNEVFIPHPPSRRLAREVALKSAYLIEMRGCTLAEALQDPLINIGAKPPAFTVRMLTTAERNRDYIDEVVRSKVEKWEYNRMALLDKLVLRLATTELLYFPDVPPKVSINEAIEIIKIYSTDKSPRFVNGVLDAIWNDLEKESFRVFPDGSIVPD